MAGILRRLTRRGTPSEPAEAPGTLELRGNGTRVVLVPALGARITTLEVGGRQWLRAGGALEEHFEASAATPPRPATPGESADAATVESSDDPSAQRAEVRVETTAEGNIATCVWRGQRAGWRLERRVRVAPTGEIEMRYAATNESKTPLPYRWSTDALLPLTPETRLLVTEGTALRVGEAQGISIGGRGAEHRWPHVRLDKSIADLSRPARIARKYACRLYLQMKDGRLGVEDEGLRLELAFDQSAVPALGLWLNHRGARMGEERSPDVLGVSPSNGMPDAFDERPGDGDRARVLKPGERREWSVTWSAHTVGPTPAR